MEVLKLVEVSEISEIKILHNVRVLHRRDLNSVYSKDNLRVQFDLSGDVKGKISCHLCLDGHELSHSERNFIFPLFVESMNILIGRQVSSDTSLKDLKIRLSPPKISMIPMEINTSLKNITQKYELEVEERNYTVLIEYGLEALN